MGQGEFLKCLTSKGGSMRDTKDILDFDIYPNLDRAEAVKELNPLHFH